MNDPSMFIRPSATHSWLQRWSRWRRRVARDLPMAMVSRAPTKAQTTAPARRRPLTSVQSWFLPTGSPPGTLPVVSIPRHLTYSGQGLRVVALSPTHRPLPAGRVPLSDGAPGAPGCRNGGGALLPGPGGPGARS